MALEIGSVAPGFELSDQFGATVRLADFVGIRAVALVFFPLAFSGTCTTELSELRDNISLFRSRGVELIGISVDSKASLRAWAGQEGYDFTLLADFWPHGAVAREYGVFVEQGGVADRGTFLIDATGVIRASFIAPPGGARSLSDYGAAIADVFA